MFNRVELNTPMAELQLSIRPMVQTCIQKMLLNDTQVNAAIQNAVENAVISADWQGHVEREVLRVMNQAIEENVKHVISSVIWDSDVLSGLKKLLAKKIGEQLAK